MPATFMRVRMTRQAQASRKPLFALKDKEKLLSLPTDNLVTVDATEG